MVVSQRSVDVHHAPNREPGVRRVVGESRAAAVGAEIRRAIVEGRLQLGEKLGEVALASSLGVSRPTVREAFVRLAREGLVEQEPYRGFRVGTVTESELRDIAVARVGLDMLAIDEILCEHTDRRIDIVRAGWRIFERSAFSDDLMASHEAHLAFHRSIWLASENSLLIDLWPVTESRMTLAIAQDQRERNDPERAYRLHERIMRAVETRERAAIRDVIVEHTIGSVDELIALHHPGVVGDAEQSRE